MAAPCRLCGVLRIGSQLGRLERHARVATHQFQQYRFKKGQGRVKPAPVHSDTGTFIIKKKKPKVSVQEVSTRELKVSPEDDVWIGKYYVPIKYDIVKAIQMHREFCQPAMLNAPNAKLNLSVMLDLRTKKKTKFMNVIKKTLVLPHDFDDGHKNRVMVFVKDEELQKIAEEEGATYVGGADLVQMVEKGEIRYDDYDHVVCHVDMLTQISSIRKALRDHFPHKSKGNVGGDVRQMVSFFAKGKTYESIKLEEAVGKLNIALGTLDMSDEQLMANHDAYIETICSHRSPQLGPFITKGTLSCPPSPETFLIDPNLLRPVSQRQTEVKALEQEEEEVVKKDEDSDDDEPAVVKKKNK